MLFIGFQASSQYLRTELADTSITLNPIPHLRKGIKA